MTKQEKLSPGDKRDREFAPGLVYMEHLWFVDCNWGYYDTVLLLKCIEKYSEYIELKFAEDLVMDVQ